VLLLQYNIFGRTFKSVLEHPDCNIMWDDNREAFDSAVVYVHKASIQVRQKVAARLALLLEYAASSLPIKP
jgi:hypothetical protein